MQTANDSKAEALEPKHAEATHSKTHDTRQEV